jgi:O-methyltransferase
LPDGSTFPFDAFHPKALNDDLTLAGLLAYSVSDTFPSLIGQWYADRTDVNDRKIHERVYSYGDSAGFTPDFPFNPPPGGTKITTKVKEWPLNSKEIISSGLQLFMKNLIRKANSFIKDLLLVSRIGVLLAPFRRLFQFFLNFSLLSSWVNRYSGKVNFSDFYKPLRAYDDRLKLYQHILEKEELGNKPLHYLEFGVAGGTSFSWWLNANKHPASLYFGFDTFEGLPEDWHFYKKGDMGYDVPRLQDARAKFIKGLFQDTLYDFLDNYRNNIPGEDAIRIIHLDADLYSSTLFALTMLAPYLRNGDILFFDEFNVPNHEFAAWNDFVRSYYVKYEVMGAVNNFYQTSFKIVK